MLLRELRAGRLDLVLALCAPPDDALQRERLRDEPAVVHLDASHPFAERSSIALSDLRDETLIVAGAPDSTGFTSTIVRLCRDDRFEPHTIPAAFALLAAAFASTSAAVRSPIYGADSVAKLLARANRAAATFETTTVWLNGGPAGRIEFDGEVGAAVSLVVENGRVTAST